MVHDERGVELKSLLNKAIEILQGLNVTYADVRVGEYRSQNVTTRDFIATNIADNVSRGMGIRVCHKGGWGFASSGDLCLEGIEATAVRASRIAAASAIAANPGTFAHEDPWEITWVTPFEIDPFSIPISEKLDFLLSINKQLLSVTEIQRADSMMDFSREHKLYMSTQGAFSDQTIYRAYARTSATAVGPEGFESRYYETMPLNAGYEVITGADIPDHARHVAEEAVQKLKAPICPHEVTDLIILPSHTALTIHETIGHATELDRVMGWEADMAGTSFATLSRRNDLKYGSDDFNVVADRTLPGGRASVPMDDEGVRTGKWHLIENGILRNYATTRLTAQYLGETRSRGCSFADSWRSLPILRMPNVSIEPGSNSSPSLDELIADTKKGILVDGRGSFSIDHQRINFQFGGDCAWRIENGQKREIIRRFTYQSHNPVFWNSVDAICNREEWKPYGVVNCGKGQPMQRAQLTHGSAPIRLKNIMVGRAQI